MLINETFKKIFSLFHIQFSKFIVVGLINTGVDFAVLNLLVLIFGLSTSNISYPIFKTISFLVAVTNSYLMNRFWVFSNLPRNKTVKNESLLFLLVSVCGFVLNVAVAYGVFHLASLLYGNLLIASNIGAICGTLLVLFFNYFGYRFIVFK